MITNVIIVGESLYWTPWNTGVKPLVSDSESTLNVCIRETFGATVFRMKLSVKHWLKPSGRATPIAGKCSTTSDYRNEVSHCEQHAAFLYRDHADRNYPHSNVGLSAHASITTSKGFFWSVFQGCGWHSYTDTSELLFPPHANRHQNIQAQEDFLTIKRCPPRTYFISSDEKKT